MIEFHLIFYGQKYYSWFNYRTILTSGVASRTTALVLNGSDLIPSFQFNVERLFMAPLQNSILLEGVFTNWLLGKQEILDTNEISKNKQTNKQRKLDISKNTTTNSRSKQH